MSAGGDEKRGKCVFHLRILFVTEKKILYFVYYGKQRVDKAVSVV